LFLCRIRLRRTSIQKRHRRGLSSCDILFFLSFVARQGFVVDEYRDEAIGFLKKDEQGPLVMSKLILRPKSIYTGNSPDGEAEDALRHRAHLGTPEVNPQIVMIYVGGPHDSSTFRPKYAQFARGRATWDPVMGSVQEFEAVPSARTPG
jgi:hypothetical protein